MSITYDPDPGNLCEVQVAVEGTYGTYQAPTVQFATTEAPSFGLGHQVIQGAALTSTIQKVITHAAQRGIETPYVSFTCPLSNNSLATLMHMLMGEALGATTANTWGIIGNPPGFTVGVNSQRPGPTGGDFFKFTGVRVGAAAIEMPLGGMPTIRLDCLGRRLLYPDTGATTAIQLEPTTSARPYILTDTTMKHAAAVGDIGAAVAVKVKGFSMAVDLGLLVDHNSSGSSPDHITRTAFDVTGSIRGWFSADWWDEWKALIPGDDGGAGGYSLEYLDFYLTDGSNPLRFTIPARVDMPGIAPDDRALDASLTFIGAGDDTAGTGGIPTVSAFRVKNV